MMVEPESYVEAMTQYWQSTLNNVPSSPLRAVWRQMAHTFNRQIESFGTSEAERWKVLQPATGTGKSQGLAVYCSMLPEDRHPGVLIVTRLKAQADELATTINAIAGQKIALAYHSGAEASAQALVFFPVVIITHKAYENGLDAINAEQPHRSNWSSFMAWEGSGRRLVVIDEALDIIEEAQVTAGAVRILKAVLPLDLADRFPEQMKLIDMVETLLLDMAKATTTQEGRVEREKVLWCGDVPLPEACDLTPLRRALRNVRLDLKLAYRDDLGENNRLFKRFDDIIRGIHLTVDNWNWYAKKNKDHTINSARLIVPEDAPGAVIMDATASSNLIYQLFDRKVDIIQVPGDARRYDNVTLHVSRGHAVGKVKLKVSAQDEAPRLLGHLEDTLETAQDRRVLIVCHKAVKPRVVSLRPNFGAFSVAHWGAIDGRNDWDTYDTAVIFGLPYRDNVWSANTFMSLRGVQTTDWLQADGDRPFRRHKDIRHSLKVGQLVVNIVQAINRVRCRRVIDNEGHCLPTNVYLLLPNDATGVGILEGIKREMPGINVASWDYAHAKRKVRRSNHEEALVSYASVMHAGRKAMSTVKRDLRIPRSSGDRLTSRLRDNRSPLRQRLAEHGVSYIVEGAGRGQRAFIVKA